MENCVRSAREAGVFREFHVLTDGPVEGCESYDCHMMDKAHGMFKLHYLKAGMSRLKFDYFVWLDADSRFLQAPLDIVGAIGVAPLHVPLERSLRQAAAAETWKGAARNTLKEWYEQEGVANEPFACGSAFWIIHHDAIETVYELAVVFWERARAAGIVFDVSAALGYAMQMLCGSPEAHLQANRPDLWLSDDERRWERFVSPNLNRLEPSDKKPSIIHAPWLK